MSSLNELKVDVKRGRPSKPLALTLEEGGVDVMEALSAGVGIPMLVDNKVAKEEAAREAKEAKAAARSEAKKEAAAAKAALRAEEKAAREAKKEAAREAAREAKKEAREALKADKEAKKEALKAEKAALRAADKALRAEEKAAAKEALKAEKEAKRAAAKEAKKEAKREAKEAKKPAPQLVAALQRADEPVPELQVEGYEEEEEVSVRVFEHKGKRWLRDDGGAIYDPETHDEVGRWDEESQSVVAMKKNLAPVMMCDNA